MAAVAPHERFRRLRAQRGEDLGDLSARTGLRAQHVRAIEEGRFSDLPRGIYGRAAIRTLAVAYGADPDELLADCEPLLPEVEDPISAIARLQGITRPPRAAKITQLPASSPPELRVGPKVRQQPELRWRAFAAACVDAAVVGALLLLISAGAAALARVSPAEFGPSAIALFLVAIMLMSVYYVSVGGLVGTTLGEAVVGPAQRQRDPRPLTLRAIALRTSAAATADVRAICALGEWTGRRIRRAAARTARPPAPSPSPPPPPGRGEVLTWSMSRRASVPPPPLRLPRG